MKTKLVRVHFGLLPQALPRTLPPPNSPGLTCPLLITTTTSTKVQTGLRCFWYPFLFATQFKVSLCLRTPQLSVSLADSHGVHGCTRGCVVSQTTPGSPAPSMAPSRPYDGGHGAGDGPPPQRSRSEEKSGGGAEGRGVALEAQRHKWPDRNSSVGRAARASVGCLCAAAAGRRYVCGCWCSSPGCAIVGGRSGRSHRWSHPPIPPQCEPCAEEV